MNYSNSTVVITGASSGIGEAFARRLASRGASLVLVARRLEKLESLAQELLSAYGSEVVVISMDLSQPNSGSKLVAELQRRDISPSSLINNAGFGLGGKFEENAQETIDRLIAVNITALTDITHSLLPQILAAGNGFIINIASNAAYQPVPLMAVYGASKAYVLSFSEALWFEVKKSGVKVLCLSPGPTRTEFFDVVETLKDPKVSFQTPEQVVKTAMDALSKRSSPPSVISGIQNKLGAFGIRFLPRRLAIAMSARYISEK